MKSSNQIFQRRCFAMSEFDYCSTCRGHYIFILHSLGGLIILNDPKCGNSCNKKSLTMVKCLMASCCFSPNFISLETVISSYCYMTINPEKETFVSIINKKSVFLYVVISLLLAKLEIALMHFFLL